MILDVVAASVEWAASLDVVEVEEPGVRATICSPMSLGSRSRHCRAARISGKYCWSEHAHSLIALNCRRSSRRRRSFPFWMASHPSLEIHVDLPSQRPLLHVRKGAFQSRWLIGHGAILPFHWHLRAQASLQRLQHPSDLG